MKVLATPHPRLESGAAMLSNDLPSAATPWRHPTLAARSTGTLLIDYLLERAQIADAEPWAIFPQEEQIIKAEHLARCLKRWGINARSSGWERFCRSWRRDAVLVPACIIKTPAARPQGMQKSEQT